MKPLSLHSISLFRKELMGISAIGIILCHMPFYCTELPGIVKSLFLLGDYGVDMFLFLSGLGIWTSLASSKIKRNVLCYKWGGLFKWYKKRYIRLLVPYCVIMIPFYAWQCTHYNLGGAEFILRLSTISFWTSHNSVWFVALLIPLYALTPVVYSIIHSLKGRTIALIFLLIIVICYLLAYFDPKGGNDYLSEEPYLSILGNVRFCLRRVTSYILGFFLAPYIMRSYKLKRPFIVCLLLLAIAITIMYLVPFNVCVAFLLVLPSSLFLGQCLAHSPKWLVAVFSFMGVLSLESYLLNISLPRVMSLQNWNLGIVDLSYGNYCMYITTVMISIIIAVAVNRLSRKIIKTIA